MRALRRLKDMNRVDALDWDALGAQLDARG